MEITDAQRLKNDAPTITLNDGRKLKLHFGYGGLEMIEAHFGSLQGLTDALGKGAGGAFFSAVLHGLHCALWQTQIPIEQLREQLDPADIESHGTILSDALMLAFPKQVQASNAASGEAVSQNGSTGPAITTSQPLSVVGPITTSG